MPGLLFGPGFAVETLALSPLGSGAPVSGELLPDKSESRATAGSSRNPRRGAGSQPPAAPWFLRPLEEDRAVHTFLAFWKTSDPLLFSAPVAGPGFALYATDETPEGIVGGDAGTGGEPAPAPVAEVDQAIDPPAEDDPDWSPEEREVDDPARVAADAEAAEAAAADDPVRANGNLLPVEQRVGNGVITGEVSDATTLEPIGDAIVTIVGQGREAETDAQGRFRIDGLPIGDYTVEALKPGYSMATAAASPRPGSPVEVRLALRVRPTDTDTGEFMLAEEVIVGEYADSSQGDFNLELQATPNLASGIDRSEFSSSGVSDAADAVSKIAGANIIGGKYAVVRGLADRYSNTLVNAGIISSADPSRKAIQLDLFPSDLLERLSIQKTFTPDLPADFAGGTVLIETLKIPDERLIDLSVGTKYRETLDGEFYVIPGQRLSFSGDGSEGPPPNVGRRGGSLANNPGRFAPGSNVVASAGQEPTALQLEAAEQWTSLHATGPFIARKASPQDSYDFSLTYGDSFRFPGGPRLGWVLALTREQAAKAERDVDVQRLAALAGPLEPYRRQIENRFIESVDWGFLGVGTLEFNEEHSVSYTFFRNRAAANEVNRIRFTQNRQGDGDNIFNSEAYRNNYLGASGIAYRATDLVTYLDRELQFDQITGEHIVKRADGRDQARVRWGLSESTASESRPDDRVLRFTTLDFTDPRIPAIIASAPPSNNPPAPYRPELGIVETLANPIGGNPQSPYRQTFSTVDEGTNIRLDLEVPIHFDDAENDRRKLTLKAGVNDSSRARESRGSRFAYTPGLNRPPLNLDQIDELFRDLYVDFDDPKWIQGGSRPARGEPPFAVFGIRDLSDAGTLILNSDSGIDVTAGYLMGELDWERWRMYGGARVEDATRTYSATILTDNGVNLNNSTQANSIGSDAIRDTELYPSVGISRTFGSDEQFNILLAYSRTVARPTFLEFAPVITEDQATGEELRGNPRLKDSEITNFDLSLSWSPRPSTFLQASLFNKSLTEPITKVLGQRASDGFFISYANAESGSIQGVEVEFDHAFNENWSIGSNVTYLNSELDPGIASIPAPILAESFEGQPNWILNLNLGFQLPDKGFRGNLVYNFTGDYLFAVSGSSAVPSVVKDATNTMDLILNQRFKAPWGYNSVTFKVSNLLNSAEIFSYEDGAGNYSRFRPGRTFSISLSGEF